jgi:hypothetical protein
MDLDEISGDDFRKQWVTASEKRRMVSQKSTEQAVAHGAAGRAV